MYPMVRHMAMWQATSSRGASHGRPSAAPRPVHPGAHRTPSGRTQCQEAGRTG